MKSQPLITAEVAHARRTVEVAKAAELAEKYPGWRVFSSRDSRVRMATRCAGSQAFIDDGVFSQTLLADDWDDLEAQLRQQAQADAMRSYEVAP
jgi:hypothetical protein